MYSNSNRSITLPTTYKRFYSIAYLDYQPVKQNVHLIGTMLTDRTLSTMTTLGIYVHGAGLTLRTGQTYFIFIGYLIMGWWYNLSVTLNPIQLYLIYQYLIQA